MKTKIKVLLFGFLITTVLGGVAFKLIMPLNSEIPLVKLNQESLQKIHNMDFNNNNSEPNTKQQLPIASALGVTSPEVKAEESLGISKKSSLSEPQLSAVSALAVDVDSGQILFQKNKDEKRQLASITKLMTAAIVLDHYEYGKGKYIMMSPTAFNTYGGNSLHIKEQFMVEDVLKALLMASSNDAAMLLAENFGQSDPQTFVDMMNAKASTIGMKNTHFANPHGLDEPDHSHYSNAFDVYKMGTYILAHYPKIAEILRIQNTTITSQDGRPVDIKNSDVLLGKIGGMVGGKTGLTDQALETFFCNIEINGKKLAFVVLGSSIGGGRFEDTKKMVQWVEASYNL